MDVNEELKYLEKFKKKIFLGGGVGLGGQDGCEQIEVFVKIQKKIVVGGVGCRFEGHVRCERRIEVFVKIQKKKKLGRGGRVGGGGGGSGWM